MRSARRLLQAAAVLIVLAALSGSLYQLDRYETPKELVLHLAAVGAAAFVLRAGGTLRLGVADLLLGGWLLLSAASALVAVNGWLAIRSLGISASALALFWSARGIARAGLGRPLLVMLAFGAMLGAATGLLQAYGVDLPLEAARRAPGGMLGNRNFMAHLTALALPIVVYLTISSRWRWAAIPGGIGVVIGSAALLLSRSRAAWLAVLLAVLFLLVEGIWIGRLWQQRRVTQRIAALAVAGVLALGAAIALPNSLDWRSDRPYLESLAGIANYREGSGRGRLIQWRNSLDMVPDHGWLGVGPGNWAVHYPKYTTPDDPAFAWNDPVPTNPWPSSDWIAMVAERGVPATLLLLAALASMALVGWRRARRAEEEEQLAGLAMVAVMIAAAVAGTFDAVLLLAAPTLLFWTTLGLLQPEPRAVVTLERPRFRRALQWILLLGGSLFIGRSALEAAAIMVAGDGNNARRVHAALAIDESQYRLRIYVARQRGAPCSEIQLQTSVARRLYPWHRAPRALARRCE